MSNKVIFHIGIHKTGTTSLQYFLYTNEECLEKAGYTYPHILEDLDCIPFPREHIHKNGGMFYQYCDESDLSNEYWNILCNYIRHKNQDYNVIISAEGIVNHAKSILLRAVKEFSSVQVVVYLRRQDRLIESLWNQVIKAGDYAGTFAEFVSHAPEWLDYYETLSTITGIVGKENVIVRIYDKKELVGGKIELDFISAIGLQSIQNEFVLKRNSSNEKLSNEFLELKRNFNEVGLKTDSYVSKHFRYVFEHISALYSGENDKNCYFTPADREAFFNSYSEGNLKVAKEYLDRDVLFPLEDINDFCSCVDEPSNYEKSIIRSFSGIVLELDRRITQIEKRLGNQKKHEEFLINQLAGDRDIVILGAGKYGKKVLCNSALNFSGVFDNNSSICGKKVHGYVIQPAKELKTYGKKFILICAEETYFIEKQLNEYGLFKEKDYILAKEYLTSVIYDDSVFI